MPRALILVLWWCPHVQFLLSPAHGSLQRGSPHSTHSAQYGMLYCAVCVLVMTHLLKVTIMLRSDRTGYIMCNTIAAMRFYYGLKSANRPQIDRREASVQFSFQLILNFVSIIIIFIIIMCSSHYIVLSCGHCIVLDAQVVSCTFSTST